MKNILIILLLFFSNSSIAIEKRYESYEEIVDRLSQRRREQIKTQVYTSLPSERFHVSLGAVTNSSSYQINNIGTINSQGLLFGFGLPVIQSQLYLESNIKFFKDNSVARNEVSLQQLETRFTHKEPLSFALFNMGVGLSARYLEAKNTLNGDNKQYVTPNMLFLLGLERRFTERVSVAGDLSYHRSLRSQDDGKNVIDFAIRLNYHL